MSNALLHDDLPPEAYIGREVTVRVRNIAFGGSGIGEVIEQADGGSALLGIAAFVPFTAIGETVRARIIEYKKRHILTELLKVMHPAAERVSPECEYFGSCGGCELQHLDYGAECDAKNKMIRGAFQAAKLPQAVISAIEPIVASEPYGYRRRLSLHVDRSGKIGLYRAKTRAVVPITSCSIVNEHIAALLPQLPEFGKEVGNYVNSLILDADDRRVVAVCRARYDLGERERDTVIRIAKKYFQNAVLRGAKEEIGGFGTQILDVPLNAVGSIKLRVPAGTFSQVNERINQLLIEGVISKSGASAESTVYDLYAGAGNFSLPLARIGADVIAVELDKRLVGMARENAERYSLRGRVEIVEQSVEKFLKPRDIQRADIVIADPPRSGLGALVGEMKRLADRLCLISCNQASCVRDVKALVADGWSVKCVQPFDMFARTSYSEILTVLSRESAE